MRTWLTLELCLILILLVMNNAKGKNYTLELLNMTLAEEMEALQHAVGKVNKQLVAKNASFMLQIREKHQKLDLYTYSSSLVNSDVIALLDFNTLPHTGCQISTITKIPIIRFHGSGSYNIRGTCNAIIMSAVYDSFAQATILILDAFQWKTIALMVESSRFYEAFFFKTFTANKGYTSTYIQIDHDEINVQKNECSCERLMKELAASEADVVLLFADKKASILMMDRCNPIKTYVWIMQDSVEHDALKAISSHMVVGFGQLANHSAAWNSKQDTFDLVHGAISMVAMALKQLHDDDMWLPGNSRTNLTSNRQTLYRYIAQEKNNSSLVPTVQFDTKGRRKVEELRVLNLVNNTFTEIGRWTKAVNALTFTDRIHFNDKSLDGSQLKGREISVVTAVAEPFVMTRVLSNGEVTFHGFCIDILKQLASELKFTYRIKLARDGFYGALIKGEWNGMIRELIDEKADMIAAPLTRNVERQKAVAMTASFMYYTDNMIMKKTVIEDFSFFQFMAPYTVNVWTVVAGSLVAVALAVFILNYYSPYGYKDECGIKTSEELNLINSFWFSAGSLLLQGPDHTPKAISGRILVGFFWFVILVWYSTYTANLVAFFTVDMFIKPVTNFEEAVNSDYDLGVIEKSNLHSLFKNAEYHLYKKAWEKMKHLPINGSQVIQWIKSGRPYIHILDGPILKYIAQKQPCDLFTFPGLQSPRSYAFALRQGDPHVQEISLAMLRLRENGFIERLRHKYWDSTNECPDINKNRIKNKQIELRSVAGVFVVLAVGFLVALLTLAIEIYWHGSGRQTFLSLKEKAISICCKKGPKEMMSNEN